MEPSVTYPSGAISLPQVQWDAFMPQSGADRGAHSISSSVSGSQDSQRSFTSASTAQPSRLGQMHSFRRDLLLRNPRAERVLSANLADLENLVRMTSVQAECVRGLGGWHGGLFMAASKVLGEETVAGGGQEGSQAGDT
ncbi:hypothetical protein O988_03177 [Pseudogymnoascus sp. VKM F-3808]|nr:hypothetical protein O988_03177 [Pseudogymnoascus sp. VKM F-3808]